MTGKCEIVRIAAKGDGVAATGEHFRGAVTGDHILPDGSIERGPHYQSPPCKHFATCGGCALQHADDAALKQFVTERVVLAAKGQELAPKTLLETHVSPSHTRRRATMHAMRTQKGAVLGFREGKAHRIVDLAECHILQPELFALTKPLRELIARFGAPKRGVEIDLSLVDQGVDCAIKHLELEGLEASEAAVEFAQSNGLARLSFDWGYGAEPLWEPDPITISLSGVRVAFPSGAFLQAAQDAETLMIGDADACLDGALVVADLFAGLGTFAFGLAKGRQIVAVEASQQTHLACKQAAARSGGAVTALHRDLFRNPIQPDELKKFDAAVLDPPRAGAREQITAIAESGLERVVYISCNPASWARDAKRLADAGFTLETLRPVGQFRWSTHVELMSYFTR